MLLAWIVFPLVLVALAVGCGLLLERLAGRELPGTLVAPAGLATMIVLTSLTTLSGATASLAIPVVVAVAVAGWAFVFVLPLRGRRVDSWAVGASVAVFAVYAAPVVLSGQATFAGFLTLDDTATWLALTDQVLSSGRDLGGLEPSSYEATVAINLTQGYPVGTFLPLGVGGKLVGIDIAWVFQPYIAFAAGMLALSLYELTSPLVRSPRLRALATFIAAQPALLYAYSQWSGVKEVVSAAMIALFAALLAFGLSWVNADHHVRRLLPLGTAIAAELAALSLGGAIWLVTGLLAAAVILGLADRRLLAKRAVALTGVVLLLSLPVVAIAGTFVGTGNSAALRSKAELGNLIRPLDRLQVFGIWPSTDFRFAPAHPGPTYVLIAVLAGAAACGLWFAWHCRARPLLLYVSTLLVGCLVLVATGSPWIDFKAMATASTALLLAAVVGCAVFFERGRHVEVAIAFSAIAGGVLWSNALAYHSVWLAPRPALAELESIGNRFAGAGPTLMTEYQPYGVRHFLRRMDPESAGELRRRLIPLLDGQGVPKGGYADLDQFQTSGILVYRTLVLRRSPSESRPPSNYQLAWRGGYYEVWQRPDGDPGILRHLPLGGAVQPGGTPKCSDVLQLAAFAGRSGRLASVARQPVIAVNLAAIPLPSGWQVDSDGRVVPNRSGGTLETDVRAPIGGRYSFWLGGSFRDRMRLLVDGNVVADMRHWINNAGQYTPFGSAVMRRGAHHVALKYQGPDLHPGSGGAQFGLGPLVLSRDDDDAPVAIVPSADARTLCGRNLDWIEALEPA